MIEYLIQKPTLDEYKTLRNAVDWNLDHRGISDDRAKQSIDAAPLCILARDQDKLIGMVRLSGDLGMYGYIQDTIVLPEYQGKGVGKSIMTLLIGNLRDKPGYLLGVCPSKVSVEFYSGFGFKKRPENPNGFMSIEFK